MILSKILKKHFCLAVLLLMTSFATTSVLGEQSNQQPIEVYQVSLAIIGKVASCTDRWSEPEYYATAKRDDPVVEREIETIDDEIKSITPRIVELTQKIKPLEPREHNTVPLTVAEEEKLASLRTRAKVLNRILKDGQEKLTQDEVTEAEDLLRKRLVEVRKLENRIPLTEQEKSFLQKHRLELAPLTTKRDTLNIRRHELMPLIYMRTPGTLRVYPEDILRVRLMEDDVNHDDICETWNLVLDRETLSKGGMDLEKAGETILQVWIRRE